MMDIQPGSFVRIKDGIGKGQRVTVLNVVDLPMGTGVGVLLDGGYYEQLNPANLEVIPPATEDVEGRS